MEPTLPPGPNVTPGDISFAYPGRIVDNLRDSLILLSRVIPGVAHPSTAIYVPEIKFYDVRYPTSAHLETTSRSSPSSIAGPIVRYKDIGRAAPAVPSGRTRSRDVLRVGAQAVPSSA